MITRIAAIAMLLVITATVSLSQWTAAGLAGQSVYAITADTKNIVAGTGSQGVWRTTNNGTAWDSINKNIADKGILGLYTNGSMTIAGTAKGVCYTYTDSNAWKTAVTGLTTLFTRAIAMKGSAVFAGTEGGGFYSASQLGAAWVQNNTGLTTTTVRVLLYQGTDLLAGTTNGVYRSTNDGAQWTAQSTGLTTQSSLFIRGLAVSGSTLLAGTQGGVYVSTGPTGSWTAANIGLTDTSVEALYAAGSMIYAGTSGGVYRSSNYGASWWPMNSGYTKEVRCLVGKDNGLYAGTFGDGVYRFVFPASVSSSRSAPSEFTLEQNYPNPFNPSTTIHFSLPRTGVASLEVFNALGVEVVRLIGGVKEAGSHSVSWDASQMPAGIYFCRLQQNGNTAVRKVVLLK
jgi:hypothetical protein